MALISTWRKMREKINAMKSCPGPFFLQQQLIVMNSANNVNINHVKELTLNVSSLLDMWIKALDFRNRKAKAITITRSSLPVLMCDFTDFLAKKKDVYFKIQSCREVKLVFLCNCPFMSKSSSSSRREKQCAQIVPTADMVPDSIFTPTWSNFVPLRLGSMWCINKLIIWVWVSTIHLPPNCVKSRCELRKQ